MYLIQGTYKKSIIHTSRQGPSVSRASLEVSTASPVLVIAGFHRPRLKAVRGVTMRRHRRGFRRPVPINNIMNKHPDINEINKGYLNNEKKNFILV